MVHAIRCRKIEKRDVEELTKLLHAHDVQMVGMHHADFLHAVVCDATLSQRVHLAIAEIDSSIVGWTMAIIQSGAYWRNFAFSHPVFGLQIATKRLLAKLPRSRSIASVSPASFDVETELPPWEPELVWGKNCCSIARHIDVTVEHEFRKQGVAAELQSVLCGELRQRGVRQMDAVVCHHNVPSIRFHAKTGWKRSRESRESIYLSKRI